LTVITATHLVELSDASNLPTLATRGVDVGSLFACLFVIANQVSGVCQGTS